MERLDVNIDYGNISGYFIRLDIGLPADSLYGPGVDGSITGWLALSADDAETVAEILTRRAAEVRELTT